MDQSNGVQTEQNTANLVPALKLSTKRGFWKLLLLTPLTIGIYPLIFWFKLSDDLNQIASRYDGKKTMNALLMAILTPFTIGILYFVWFHRVSNRIGAELNRRGLNYEFNAGTFWVWDIILTCIVIGPFVFIAKLCKALNLLSEDYNQKG